jgi:hypothetical protein
MYATAHVHRKKIMPESEDWADALIENKRLEQLQDYLVRGRPLSKAPTDDLFARWIAWLNAWADGHRPQFRDYEDIEAELKLRSIKPPRERMPAAAAEKFKETARRAEQFFCDNPDELREFGGDLLAQIEALRHPPKRKS